MISIFVSYSHKDENLRKELETHLSPLSNEGIVSVWNDRRIGAGEDIPKEIDRHLEEADIVLLLVSPDFLASSYCYDREMPRAMERHEQRDARVVPVILRPCDWRNAPFGNLKAVPNDGKPVVNYNPLDDGLVEVVREIRRIATPAANTPSAPSNTSLSGREALRQPGVSPRLSPNPLLPAAEQEPSPANAKVAVRSGGRPLPGADLLFLYPNNTWTPATTDSAGMAEAKLYATHLPMTVFAAAAGYAAGLERDWTPARRALAIELTALPGGGSVIFPEATGYIPGLAGRLNPKRDTHDRTYLYASNIAIDDGRLQPVSFVPSAELRLTDAHGKEAWVRIVEIAGRSALVEYRPCPGER